MMKKACVCGNYASHGQILEGQSIKTRSVNSALIDYFGKENVDQIDTSGGIKGYIFAILKMICAMFACKNIVILPAQRALMVFPYVIGLCNRLVHRGTHYVVIGGWLNDYLEGKNFLIKSLKSFTGIYVETLSMQNQLILRGFTNVHVMPNFRKEINEIAIPKATVLEEPYSLCTFSRVMKEKGIEDAVKAVKEVNTILHREVFKLDIYGPIEPGEQEWFSKLQKSFSSSICYRGSVDYTKAIQTLYGYFALVFPTRFYTEGIPGTIIDAFGAGLPVIYSKWEHAADVLNENTGIAYGFQDTKDLVRVLRMIAEQPDRITSLRKDCISEAKKYSVQNAIKTLITRLA